MANPRLVFFGNERLATGVTTTAPVLRALLAAGYEIAAVVIAQNETGRSRQNRQLEIATVAAQHRLPLLTPSKLSEIKDDLTALGAEAGILAAYGKLVPAAVIKSFPLGIINLHPSLLPKHRGSAPIENVILNGETETGVSLMQLTEKMDAGPVYSQQSLRLRGDETKQYLTDQLLEIGKNLLLTGLPNILDGSLKAAPQSEMDATYDERIKKADGELDFTQPAIRLVRHVRAYAGWPRSRTKLGTTEVTITAAHANDVNGTSGTLWLEGRQVGIHAGEGTFVIDRLIPSGKKEMSAEAFLTGYSL